MFSLELQDEVLGILKSYLIDIRTMRESNTLNLEFSCELLLLISEFYSLFEDTDYWTQFAYDICQSIKIEIEEFGMSSALPPGMIGGFGQTCFSVWAFNNKTGILPKFSSQLNKLLLKQAMLYLKYVNAQKGTSMRYYDIVSGISGVIYHLTDFYYNTDEKESLEKLIKYLVELSEDYLLPSGYIVKYHIDVENQAREDEKIEFPEGHINFGLAHGMIGPLVAMCKARARGIKVEGLNGAIEKIFLLYEKFESYHKGIAVWPTQLSVYDYHLGSHIHDLRPASASWCYGNLGVVRGLYKAAYYIDDKKRILKYDSILLKILNRSIKHYYLFEPILCHGYASVLSVRMSSYYSTQNRIYLENIENDIQVILDYIKKNSKLNEKKSVLIEFDGLIQEGDISLLMGSSGIVLSLLSTIKSDGIFTKLLLID